MALAFFALLLPPLLISVLAFGVLATLDTTTIAVGVATATPTGDSQVQALVHLQEGMMQQQTGDYAAALSSYRAALAIDPRLAPAHGALGSLYVVLEQPQPAIASYREAVRLEPDRVVWQHSLGVVLANQGQVGEGLAVLQGAVSLAPDDPMLHYELGEVYTYLERRDEARRAFQRVLTLAPDSSLAAATAERMRRLVGGP